MIDFLSRNMSRFVSSGEWIGKTEMNLPVCYVHGGFIDDEHRKGQLHYE